jgi:hypothetical protein
MEPIKKAPLAPKAAAVADAIAAPAPVPAMRTVEEPKLVPWRKGEQPQAGDGAAAPDANKAAAAAAPPVTPPPAAPAQQAAGNAAKAPATASTGQPASAPAPADGKPAAADPLGNTTAVAKAPAPAADDDDEDEEEEDEKKSGGNDLLDLFTDETGVGSDLKDLAATLEELDIKELLELCREVAGNIKVRYGQ